MAKYDSILAATPDGPTDAVSRPLRGGTMPLLRPDAMSSNRKTEPMLGPDGLLRDTVRDLAPPELEAAHRAAAPAATQERAGDAVAARAPGKPVVASDRKVSLEGFVPRSAVPGEAGGPKVDVSRVDPRRAPTQKIRRVREGSVGPDGGALDALALAVEPRARGAHAASVRVRTARAGGPVWIVLAVLLVGATALVGALAWRLSAPQPAAPSGQRGGVK